MTQEATTQRPDDSHVAPPPPKALGAYLAVATAERQQAGERRDALLRELAEAQHVFAEAETAWRRLQVM